MRNDHFNNLKVGQEVMVVKSMKDIEYGSDAERGHVVVDAIRNAAGTIHKVSKLYPGEGGIRHVNLEGVGHSGTGITPRCIRHVRKTDR